jgi:formamidopyrimidine-DNA glycosylase
MPELPEVDTMVRALHPTIVGSTIRRTRLSHDHVLKNRSRAAFLSALRRTTIHDVSRRAKNAVFDLGGARLVIQPGMTGSFSTVEAGESPSTADYTVLALTFEDGSRLLYRDVRRLGRIYLLQPDQWVAFESRLGPEPLDPSLSAEAFGARLRRTRQPIKKAIMDQRLIAGVGNIYANEALFVAGLDPSKPANRVADEDHHVLLMAIQDILRQALAAEGTTIRDYRTASGKPGNFQQQLFVYGREGAPCHRCGTHLTGTHTIDARSTVFCHRCQR